MTDYLARALATATAKKVESKADLIGGKVPESELPSYVDDVVEGYYYNSKFYKDAEHTTEISGETGKIYVDITTENGGSYRWSGSKYILIASGSTVSNVEVNPVLTTGTKIAEITVNDETKSLYAPEGGGGGTAIADENIYLYSDLFSNMEFNLAEDIDLIAGNLTSFSDDFTTKIKTIFKTLTSESTSDDLIDLLISNKIIWEVPDMSENRYFSILNLNGSKEIVQIAWENSEINLTFIDVPLYSYRWVYNTNIKLSVSLYFTYSEGDDKLGLILNNYDWDTVVSSINGYGYDYLNNTGVDFEGTDSFTIDSIKVTNLLFYQALYYNYGPVWMQLGLNNYDTYQMILMNSAGIARAYYWKNTVGTSWNYVYDEYKYIFEWNGSGDDYLTELINVTFTKVGSGNSDIDAEDASLTPDRILGKKNVKDDVLKASTKTFNFNATTATATLVTALFNSISSQMFIYSSDSGSISFNGGKATIVVKNGSESTVIFAGGVWSPAVSSFTFTFSDDNQVYTIPTYVALYKQLVDQGILNVETTAKYAWVSPQDALNKFDQASDTETLTKALGTVDVMSDNLDANCKTFYFNTNLSIEDTDAAIQAILTKYDYSYIYLYGGSEGQIQMGYQDNAFYISAIQSSVGNYTVYTSEDGWNTSFINPIAFTTDNMAWSTAGSAELYDLFFSTGLFIKSDIKWGTASNVDVPTELKKIEDTSETADRVLGKYEADVPLSTELTLDTKKFVFNTALDSTTIQSVFTNLVSAGYTSGYIYYTTYYSIQIIPGNNYIIIYQNDGGTPLFNQTAWNTELSAIWEFSEDSENTDTDASKAIYKALVENNILLPYETETKIGWTESGGLPTESTESDEYNYRILAEVSTIATDIYKATTFNFNTSNTVISADMVKYMLGTHYLYAYNASASSSSAYDTNSIKIVVGCSSETYYGNAFKYTNDGTTVDLFSLSWDYNNKCYKINWQDFENPITFDNASNIVTTSDAIIYKYFVENGLLTVDSSEYKWTPAPYSKAEIDERTKPLFIADAVLEGQLPTYEYVYAWFSGRPLFHITKDSSDTSATWNIERVIDLEIKCTSRESNNIYIATCTAYFCKSDGTISSMVFGKDLYYYSDYDAGFASVDLSTPLRIIK